MLTLQQLSKTRFKPETRRFRYFHRNVTDAEFPTVYFIGLMDFSFHEGSIAELLAKDN